MSGYVVMVDFQIKPEKLSEFRKLMIDNARTSARDESGCRLFDVVEPIGEPGRIFLYEIYDDAEAFEVHKRSAQSSPTAERQSPPSEVTEGLTESKDFRRSCVQSPQ